MARLLEEVGADVTLDELPDKEHWWWDSHKANDGGVMFDKTVRDFLKKHSEPLPLPGALFTVSSSNPAAFFGRGGCTIKQVLL
jgi:menaquinone-dependent protoporphyrinogen IX oxidase